MDFLKSIFGDQALTYDQLAEKLKDNKEIKLANLATGQYVDKAKLDTKITELDTANQTIKDLQDTVKKFDGVDVEKLKSDLAAAQQKYDADISALKLDHALSAAISSAKAKNPKAVKALLDSSKVKLDGDKLLGLDDQLEALKKSDPYLFEDVKKADSGGAHGVGGADDGKTISDEIKSELYGEVTP